MVSVSLGTDRVRYAAKRMGDWKLKLWIGGSWLLRGGCVRQCWPYRYYHICVGPVQVVLKYAPECRICVNDEHVLYPGKYCAECYKVVNRRAEVIHCLD